MKRILTSKQVAEQLDVSHQSVTRWGSRLGFTDKIGSSFVYTVEQVRALRRAIPGKVGNPNFLPGYHRGTKMKQTNKAR